MIKVSSDLWFCLTLSIFMQNDISILTVKKGMRYLSFSGIIFIFISCFIFANDIAVSDSSLDISKDINNTLLLNNDTIIGDLSY